MGQRQFPYWKWAGLRWLVLGAGVLQLLENQGFAAVAFADNDDVKTLGAND